MAEHVYFLTIILPLLVIIIIAALRYYANVQQARLRYAHEEAYRAMAQQALDAQSSTAQSLSGMKADLADLKTRIAAIEQVLKQVE
ncbi:hypothetical protein GTP23_10810 [Pseudoduganella sp. FT93W]|uniref:Uncharacterized protein n=1 Tax=Duganella fentianensis TaxID=2692177 RepID=A0A845I0D6_9BURK|nr:hypothetical protein [Duganella fentianensis]MYN45537.1 hypothetical protein [Duganella fentianensis]